MGKQDRELLKNIEEYEQKEEIKQSKSKVYGQKPVKGKTNKRKEISVYNSQWSKSIHYMV